MQKITPHLWFDKEAREAAEFYAAAIPDSRVTRLARITDTPSGDCDIVSFELRGQPFMAISAGPLFRFHPSVSFQVRCATVDEADALWAKLSTAGRVLMPLDTYPFSKRYGWLEDRYGLSWQIMATTTSEIRHPITPVLLFVGQACGRTEEAINFYASVFHNAPGAAPSLESRATVLARYGKGDEPDAEGTVRYAHFSLAGQEFGALDSARHHHFAFNEAISFLLPCDTQEEIDYFWSRLSADPKAEQCGWLKDPFGVSWQVTSAAIDELLDSGDPDRTARVMRAMLQMKKVDAAALQRAAGG